MAKQKKWKQHILETQLVFVVSILIFSSIIINTALIYRRYKNDFVTQTSNQTQQILEQTALNIEVYIDELRRLCLSPLYSLEIMNLLEANTITAQAQLDKRRIIERFLKQGLTIPREDILQVYILSSELYYSGRTSMPSNILQSYLNEEWYKETIINQETIMFSPNGSLSSVPTNAIISVARRLNSLDDPSQMVGVIRVDATYHGIKSICDRVNLGKNSALYIVNENNTPIYQNISFVPGFEISEEFISDTNSFKEGSNSINFNGSSYLMNVQNIRDTSWRIIMLRSSSELIKGMWDTQKYILFLAIFFSLTGVSLTVFIVRKFMNPLAETVKRMKEVQKGDLSVRVLEKGNNEITYLNYSFNKMLSQIQDMIKKDNIMQKRIYEAGYLQKAAQYDALYNQIQPHFFFNTLNTISLLIKMNQNSDAIICIDHLSILLRGIAKAASDITLEAELKIVESYLKLQQKRWDYLKFDVSFLHELVNYELPALTIQPIVENAIIHGLGQLDSFHINIAIYMEKEYVTINVSDNGVGMDSNQLIELIQRLNADDEEKAAKTSIGLINVKKRMKLKFGDKSNLLIDSTPNKGTQVTLQLPIN